ncbi:hypothetical protein [Zobellella taiwanensis]|jgi:hypothetical protein
MTVQSLPLRQLLQQPLRFVLWPPALRFYLTHALVLLASLAAVAAALWYGRQGFGLIHWVGAVFGGVLLLVSLWPANWSRQRLVNLAFDDDRLYIVNGIKGVAMALPRERVLAVNRGKLPGHDGAIIAFTLDLSLSEAELECINRALGAQAEERFRLDEQRYRFGFVGNWQPRRRLLERVSVLAPVVAVTGRDAPADEDDDDWDD